MGWRFRRSVKMGPIRWNLSRRGVALAGESPGFESGYRPMEDATFRLGFRERVCTTITTSAAAGPASRVTARPLLRLRGLP